MPLNENTPNENFLRTPLVLGVLQIKNIIAFSHSPHPHIATSQAIMNNIPQNQATTSWRILIWKEKTSEFYSFKK